MQTIIALVSLCFATIMYRMLKEEKEISLYGSLTREEYKHISLRLITQNRAQLSQTDYRKRKCGRL